MTKINKGQTQFESSIDQLQSFVNTQTGNSGKFLTTNGTTMSWQEVSATLTAFEGNTGTTLDTHLTLGNGVQIYKNGMLLENIQDYTISGSVITFVTALVATDKISVLNGNIGAITIDGEMSSVSTNPVQNKVITQALLDNYEELGVYFPIQNGVMQAAGTRLGWAAGKNFTPSTDVVAGLDDFKDHPIYKGYYAISHYNAETQQVEVYPEGTYEYAIYRNTNGYDEFKMFHIFYYKLEINDYGMTIHLRLTPKEGYTCSPAHLRNGVTHEWIGLSRYPYSIDYANAGVHSRANLAPYTNIQVAAESLTTTNCCEYLARQKGLKVFSYYEVTMLQLLGLVKYANLNWQTAVASGITSRNEVKPVQAVAVGDSTLAITEAAYTTALSQVILQSYVWANNKWFAITAVEDVTIGDVACKQITIDGTFTGALTTDSSLYIGPMLSGLTDSVKGDDGYYTNNGTITSADRRPCKHLGIENLYGTVGARLTAVENIVTVTDGVATAKMYVNPNSDNDYLWTSADNDKNWTLVTDKLCTTSNNQRTFVKSENLNIPMLVPSNDGTANTGDHTYATANAGRYSVFFGGNLGDGTTAGGFFSRWNGALSGSSWSSGFRGVLVA